MKNLFLPVLVILSSIVMFVSCSAASGSSGGSNGNNGNDGGSGTASITVGGTWTSNVSGNCAYVTINSTNEYAVSTSSLSSPGSPNYFELNIPASYNITSPGIYSISANPFVIYYISGTSDFVDLTNGTLTVTSINGGTLNATFSGTGQQVLNYVPSAVTISGTVSGTF